jgi:hypothetical protein
MPQYPIKSQAYVRGPGGTLPQMLGDKSGRIYASERPGNGWFVDETNGDDTAVGNFLYPFATLTAAKAVAADGDTIYIIGTVHISATLVWDVSGVSLVGIDSPSNNSRARISQTGSAVFTPLVSVTAQGCTFENLATFHGFANASAQVCWAEAGGRNYYKNVQFFGGGDATAAAQAGCRSLTVAGSGENLFENCTFGLDTIARATNANATLEFLAGTARNVFRCPTFQMLSKLAGNVHVKALAAALDRYAYFDEPAFINAVESTAVTIDQDISANAAAGGAILLKSPISLGATALAAAGPVYIVGTTPVATTSGIAIKAT